VALPSAAASRRGVTLLLGLLATMGPLSTDMYLPAFPAVAHSFGVDVSAVQLTLAAYLAGLAVGQLVYGPLADRVGRRPPLLAGLALYVAAALACAAAPGPWSLAAARFAQALGGCAGMVVSRAVVRDLYEVGDASRIYSTLILIMGIAPILAPLAGGQVLAAAGWRAIFLALALAGGLLLLLVWRRLPESLAPEARRRHGIAGVAEAFRSTLASGRFVRLSLAGGAIQAAMFAYIAASPMVFIQVHGVSPQRFGLFFGANAAGLVAASQANRWLSRRFGVWATLRAGVALAVAAYGTLALGVWLGAGLWVVAPALFVGVSCYGLVLPNTTAAAMGIFGSHAGSASSVLGVLQSACGALAAVAVSALADGTARPLAQVSLASAVLGAILVGPGLSGRPRPGSRPAQAPRVSRVDPADQNPASGMRR
jgi:DHA1 family bicyclomycin/chloramphenicol resistance-like MFS transporter